MPDYWSWDYGGEKHWKWANDPYYSDEPDWIAGQPDGYKVLAQRQAGQNLAQAGAQIPDYWSWDYGGEKHWKWANDPYYSDEAAWIEGQPNGYKILA